MALNQLQYMSLSMSVIKYDDIRQRLLSSAKDEDISPFTAVGKYEIIDLTSKDVAHVLVPLHFLLMRLLCAASNFLLYLRWLAELGICLLGLISVHSEVSWFFYFYYMWMRKALISSERCCDYIIVYL